MRILVTGGNGYIGQATITELLNRGHHPIVIDNLSAGNLLSIPIDDFIWEDIRFVNLKSIIDKYEIESVLHLAALASVPTSIQKPLEYYDVNVNGTFRLLQAMKQTGVSRIVFSTTGAIESNTPYGHTKLACEHMIKDILVDATILRYFNVVGGNDHSQEHVFPRILKATEENPFQVCGSDYDTRDGTCERDYVSVKDVAIANCIALENGTDGTYEVGTGIGTTVLELVNKCRVISEQYLWYVFTDRRPGDQASLVADRSRRLPGWTPKYILGDIIKDLL